MNKFEIMGLALAISVIPILIKHQQTPAITDAELKNLYSEIDSLQAQISKLRQDQIKTLNRNTWADPKYRQSVSKQDRNRSRARAAARTKLKQDRNRGRMYRNRSRGRR